MILRAQKTDDLGERNTNRICFDYLTKTERLEALRKKNELLESKDSELFLLKQQNLQLKVRVRTLKESLKEYSRRGDLKAICYNLPKADQQGLLNDRTVFIDTIETVARNFQARSPRGRRYNASVQQFYEALLILGGPEVCNFVSLNLQGPNIHTVYHWRQSNVIKFKPGILGDNFIQVYALLKKIKEKFNLPKTPWLCAEDETGIEEVVTYHQDTDEMIGFCGKRYQVQNDHKCLQNVQLTIGDDNLSYKKIVDAFKEYTIGKSARVLILNPLHKLYPRIIISLMPTCNRFTQHEVLDQWQQINRLFKETLEEEFGPLIGNSSDGDSRRRKLMVQLMTKDETESFRPISEKSGFTFAAVKEQVGDHNVIRSLGDQDPIHNHKKLVNHLDHVSRSLCIVDWFHFPKKVLKKRSRGIF